MIPLRSDKKKASQAICKATKHLFKKRSRWLTIALWAFAFSIAHEIVLAYDIQVNRGAEPGVFAVGEAVAFVANILASITFQKCLLKTNPNKVISIALATNAFLSSIALLYLMRVFPNVSETAALALFYSIDSFTSHIAFLPLAIIAADTCTTGLEATMYSFYMAITNLSGVASQAITAQILQTLGTKNTELHNVDIFYLLTILSQLTSMAIVVFIVKKIRI